MKTIEEKSKIVRLEVLDGDTGELMLVTFTDKFVSTGKWGEPHPVIWRLGQPIPTWAVDFYSVDDDRYSLYALLDIWDRLHPAA